MADVFISFKTDDTPRVQAVHDGFRARGLSVFWSNDIPKGAPNYQAIIKDEILKAPVVVVVWTNVSVHSGPVIQECSQAERANKLFQILLDDIEPIDMPMEVKYKSQKTVLLDWTGDRRHAEWTKLNNAIDSRLGRDPGAIPIEVGMPGRSQRLYFVPGGGRTKWFKDHDAGPEMVVVPDGKFLMGSPESEAGRPSKAELEQHEFLGAEGPRRTVDIAKPIAVGRYSITRGQFSAFVAATDHKTDGGAWVLKDGQYIRDPNASWRSPGFAQDDSHPVVCVNWNDAKAYAAWLTNATGKPYRLLSESEREYVARAVHSTAVPHPPFWWGDTITTDQANYNGEYVYGSQGKKGQYRKATMPVGSFAPNPWGLYQVHGNVWEWCEDVWHKTYEGAPPDSSAWLQGGDSGRRVVRGGSWNYYPQYLRSANRSRYTTVVRSNFLSFRLARTLNP